MLYALIVRHRLLCTTTVVLSVLVSLWALYLDPVVNIDGIIYVQAAEFFAEGRWTAGFSVYKWPFYSLVISVVAQVGGITANHAAYLVNGFFYVLLLLGFIALVKSLGGANRVLWLAALVGLLHPTLNEFRSFVIRDVGYWACYLWSLSCFLMYVREERTSLLAAGVGLAFAAALFRIEGILLLTVLPACIYVFRSTRNRRAAGVALVAALVTAVLVAAAPVWQYISEVDASKNSLIRSPLNYISDSWGLVMTDVESRLHGWRREFPSAGSYTVSSLVYLATVAAMTFTELFKTLGVVYSCLIAYAFYRKFSYFRKEVRDWWWLMVGIQGLLVVQFGVSNFFLAERYPVALALTLLTIIPFFLDDLWTRCSQGNRKHIRAVVIIAVLIAVESIEGLDLATQKRYLKDAGLWLRANAPSNSTLYSNNRILQYYSGLREAKPNTRYLWNEAMHEVWTESWRGYDYFALVMTKSNSGNEVLLLGKMEARPVKTFSSDKGDKVLIFRPE